MKTMRFIGVVVLSAAIAFTVAYFVSGDSLEKFGIIGIGLAMLIAAIMGAFDMNEKKDGTKYDSIRHYDGRRNYGQAAVFIGTACLFMGTPQECEDMTDDLWHRGVQAEFKMLTENDVDFNVL